MKKVAAVISTLVLIFTMTACSNNYVMHANHVMHANYVMHTNDGTHYRC